MGVNKLLGKVSINLLCHVKFIMPHKVSCLCNQCNNLLLMHLLVKLSSCTPKQIDLTSVLLLYSCLIGISNKT